MILVEVFKQTGERVDHQVIRKAQVSFGRHSSNDLIIPDLSIPLYAGVLSLEPDLPNKKEVILGDYRLRFTNLLWMDQLPEISPSASVKTDSIISLQNSQETPLLGQNSTAVETTTTEAAVKTVWSTHRGWGVIWILFNIAYLIHQSSMISIKRDWVSVVVEFFALNAVLLIPTTILSILSQAINRQYRFLPILRVNIAIACAWSFLNLDFFGLRWLLGEWALSNALMNLLHITTASFFFYQLSLLIFDHLRESLRRGLFIAATLLAGFALFHKYLPFRDQFQFHSMIDRPLIYPWFEEKPMAPTELTAILSKQMAEQSAAGDLLKKKMNP